MTETNATSPTAQCCRERPEGGLDGPCTWPETDCYQNGPAAPPRATPPAVSERARQVTTAIYGGIDEWDVRLTLSIAKDALTPERLAELLPEALKGGICVGVEVRRARRV